MIRIAALLAAAAVAGCATLDEPLRGNMGATDAAVRSCAEWLRELDRNVDEAGVRDAQETRLDGFPYLRLDRFLASFRDAAAANDAMLDAWVERMGELDNAARHAEILNLPQERFDALPDPAARLSRRNAVRHTVECGRMLRTVDSERAAARAWLFERARVPDDYSSLYRLLGLYALSSGPFSEGVRRYQAETLAAFRNSAPVTSSASVVRYSPGSVPKLSFGAVARLLASGASNPLGIPEPGPVDLEALFAEHAPVYEIEITGDYDRPGALRWRRDAAHPEVDAADLAVYRHAAWTRYRGRTLLQLVYTIWFAERPEDSRDDLLAGKLDGLTWRVTLAPDGAPLVYDSIHPCGCYHMFFPTPRARALPAPEDELEWLFSPQQLPLPAAGERPVLRIASRMHSLTRVSLARGAESTVRYDLRPYDELRSLPRLDGERRSAFGPDGLIAGTERPERLLFWPMGIASAGAMRQWGRHATAFVGRRHFDDADLFERRFEFGLP